MMPFRPVSNSTTNIDVGAASARVLVSNKPGRQQVRIMNNGTATVWIAWGTVAIIADVTNDMPIGPGGCEVLTFDENRDMTELYIAAIAAGSTGKVYFTLGEGI